MRKTKMFIGADLGGTGCQSGIPDKNGEIHDFASFSTKGADSETIVGGIANSVKNLIKNKSQLEDKLQTDIEIPGVGIASTGIVDTKGGIIIKAFHLGWNMFNLRDEIEQITGLPCTIINDADGAALGETLYGAGKNKNYGTAVMMTIGTGVGGSIVKDKKILTDKDPYNVTPRNAVSELGHSIYFEDERPVRKCKCGEENCFREFVMMSTLVNSTKDAMEKNKKSFMWDICGGNIDKVDGQTAFQALRVNDPSAQEVVRNYLHYISKGMVKITQIHSPDAIILGGAISANEEDKYFLDPIRDEFNEQLKASPITKRPEITKTKLKNAGIVGAAEAAKQEHERS